MNDERVIVRTVTNLSYAGQICKNVIESQGLMIKPSPKSDIKIWFPIQEIECIIKMNGNVIKGEELENECRLYESI